MLNTITSLFAALTLAAPAPDAPPAVSMIGFGTALAAAGDELLVGRPSSFAFFPLPPSSNGAVFAYRRAADGSWKESGRFTSADAALGDGFGSVLAADGNVAAVAAPAANESRGTVYLFERGASGWRQVARLALADGAAGDGLGQALALRGGWLAVGAPGRDSSRGAVYTARRDANGRWSALTEAAKGTAANDRLGAALALEGERLAAGAPGPVSLGGRGGARQQPTAGAAAVYRLSGGRWTEEARLVPGSDTTAAFGAAVHASGGGFLVSSPLANKGGGMVYEFRPGASGWAVAARVAPPQGVSLFGFTLAGAGDALLVGSPFASNGQGTVVALRRGADGWGAPQQLSAKPVGMLPVFGQALAMMGGRAIVGTPGADFFEGLAYVFERDAASGTWREAGAIGDQPEGLPAIVGGERRCDGSGKIEAFACKNVDVLSFLPPSSLGAKRGIMLNDLWGWTDAASGREFALVGRLDGTSFVEVTDPANPVFLGDLPLHEGARPNMWRDIKVYKDHAFIVSDGAGPHGMQVFDLTQLLAVRNAPVTFQETAHYAGIASAHNIAINEETGFAYPIGNSMGGETCGGALHMIDIRDPKNPTFAGCYADKSTGRARTGYTHDAQCVTYKGPDAKYQGREICFNASETAVGIADVTDKASPKPVAVAAYPNVAYAHQGWLSEDHRHFFLDDEGDELSGTTPKTRTMVWDVTKLEEPVLLTEFQGTTSASDHNLYVKGRYMFQSNYVAGLRVIDIADPKNPREVGYLDTVPFGENVPGFAGSWSNYPYFKSGTIVVTSMKEGLFVLRHRPDQPIP